MPRAKKSLNQRILEAESEVDGWIDFCCRVFESGKPHEDLDRLLHLVRLKKRKKCRQP